LRSEPSGCVSINALLAEVNKNTVNVVFGCVIKTITCQSWKSTNLAVQFLDKIGLLVNVMLSGFHGDTITDIFGARQHFWKVFKSWMKIVNKISENE
jgi:uncharacterized membrane protein YadS